MINPRWWWYGLRETFRCDTTPAALSVVALFLGLAPGAFALLWTRSAVRYDATLAVLTATLIALIWTAHYTYRSVRHAQKEVERHQRERWEARMVLASSIDAELDVLELGIGLIRTRIVVGGVDVLARPQLRQALARTDLFPKDQVRAMALLDGYLRIIEAHVALYEADLRARDDLSASLVLGAAAKIDPERATALRDQADGAQDAVAILRRLLLSM